MKKVIYYFTGTGNSMRAAEKIAARLGDTEIISMRNNPQDVSAADADVIGFVYPVYHWTIPLPAIGFINELAINPGAYIFVVAMPSFVNGYACEKLEELLKPKGGKIAYGAKVYGVGNYVISYPPVPSPKWTVPRTEKKLERIADDIAAKRIKAVPKAGAIVRKKYPGIMNRYHEVQQYIDYGFIIDEKCSSCGLCSKLCPCRNIVMADGKPAFNHNCTHCMACVCYCPKRAIGYKLPDGAMKLLDRNFIDVTLVKNMSLPPKRKIYHNPFISAADIIRNSKRFD